MVGSGKFHFHASIGAFVMICKGMLFVYLKGQTRNFRNFRQKEGLHCSQVPTTHGYLKGEFTNVDPLGVDVGENNHVKNY